MCHAYNASALSTTDAYWLLRQWRTRVIQERPMVTEKDLRAMLTRWWVQRWRDNLQRSSYAVKILGNSISTVRSFQDAA